MNCITYNDHIYDYLKQYDVLCVYTIKNLSPNLSTLPSVCMCVKTEKCVYVWQAYELPFKNGHRLKKER